MEVIVEQEQKIRTFKAQTNEEQHLHLANFMKGTIAGEELVKYVCDKLDDKYGKNQYLHWLRLSRKATKDAAYIEHK
jgi:hypothetical protein